MARHRVPVQAFRNFLSILLGFALGALNNLVILPWAFADDLGEWGLVRIVMAWASLFAPILLFGAPAAMNRYSRSMARTNEVPKLMGTLVRPSLFLFFVCVVPPALIFPDSLSTLLRLTDVQRQAVQPIAILSSIITAQLFFAGFLSSKLKTSLSTFAQETIFKLGYACLAVALGMAWLPKSSFLPAFLGLHFLVLCLLFAQAAANQFKVDLRGLKKSKIRKEIRHYGGALVMGGGASIILNQLDIIMVGSLVGLDQVPAFTVAAFIATVTILPKRASYRLLTPLISRALDQNNTDEIIRLTKMSHRTLLLSCGWIVTCIWVTTPEIDQLLPIEFQDLSKVILTLGLVKLLYGSATGSTILLAQSNHFQKVVVINWCTVALAIPLNLLFIPESGLGLGLMGAALATLITLGLSTLAMQFIVWQIWKRVIPSMQTLLICGILLVPALSLVHWNPGWNPVITLLVKSTVVTAWTAFATVRFNFAPESVQFAVQKAPWLSRWV